ncbi:MAG: DUF932 domain-containing protein [Spirochaetales bacterium]|nr:DUF932 domain-containing protein [Spirochaetales bacterium]
MKGNVESLAALDRMIRQREQEKNDLLVDARELLMVDDDLLRLGERTYSIGEVAHSQISEKLGIPKRYYDRMTMIPGLRTHNVNQWSSRAPEKKRRFVRTVGHHVRAVLSERFRPIDDILIMHALRPVLREHEELCIPSICVTERRLYIEIVFPMIAKEVLPGDVVHAGVILTNSEVGLGALDISTVVWRLVCSNGLIGQSLLNKYHIGPAIGNGSQAYDFFSSETIEAEIESFRLELRDTLRYAVSEDLFHSIVSRLVKAAGQAIPNVSKTIENVTKRWQFTESEKDIVTDNMVAGGMKTRWGLVNSITAMAHRVDDHDRQYDYERIGNEVITLSDREWEEITA